MCLFSFFSFLYNKKENSNDYIVWQEPLPFILISTFHKYLNKYKKLYQSISL